MALRRSSRHKPPSNSSTFSERENDVANSLNLNYARRRFIDTYTIKVERDVSESCDKQIRNDETNLQEIKLEPQFCITDENDLMKVNHRAAGCDVRIKTEADESCSNLHHVPIDNENLQNEDQLQNEITSELIIKSENEEESRDNNADSDGGNYNHYLISGATENKTSAADIGEKRKKIAKNVKFCAHCEFTTHSKRTLRNHIQAHVKSECEIGRQVDADHLTCAVAEVSSCACQICGRVFQRKANLTRHLKLHENNVINDKGLYECKKNRFDKQYVQCSKEFKSKQLLNQHVKLVHDAVRSFHCTQCSKSFKSNSSLRVHLAVHTDVRAFKCDKCSKSFKTNSNLQYHNKTVHSEVKPFVCKKCGKSFYFKAKLLSHGRVHSNVRPFACEVCGKMFKSNGEVKNHLNFHKIDRNFKCEHCDKKFKSKHCLYKHKRKRVIIRKYQCALCDKKFKTKQHVSQHMAAHSEERPFSCDICEKSFKFKDQLNVHSIIHKSSYDFKCNLCAAKFKCKKYLVTHIKFMHSDARQFKCDKCGKLFNWKSRLRVHMVAHLNLRQFKCDKCNQRFNRKFNLKQHSLVHSDIFAFECYVCKRKYKWKSEVKKHIFRCHM